MDWVAAKSYYIGYNTADRFFSIVFFHNYFLSWSISLFISLILPLLFLFAPSSLHTNRTSHFLIICIVCLSNMCCLYIHMYMISGFGEPNLSYHTCRFVVYISTFAKPIGIYLTFLFSTERLIGKILSKFFLGINNYKQLFRKLYKLFIFLGIIFILSIRLYEILKLIPRNPFYIQPSLDDGFDPKQEVTDTSNNSTDRNITFKFCFASMNIDTYAQLLSFYVIKYWYEKIALIIIILIFIILIIQQYRLPSASRFSINTKLYLSLSLCFITSELLLLFFDFLLEDKNKNNPDVQLTLLEFMSFIYQFRCIFLPFIIILMICDSLKQFIYEFFISRPYLDNIDDNDNDNNNTNTIDNRPEPFSSSQKSKNRLQKKFPQTFAKNNNNHNNEYLDNDELQLDV